MTQRTTTLAGRGSSTDFRIRNRANPHVKRASALESSRPSSIVRYVYYAFVFSLPYESLGWEALSLSKPFGYLLLAVALCQPRLFFHKPPKALWYFAIYLCALAILGILGEPEYVGATVTSLLTKVQLIILFWISYHLMQSERVCKGTLMALAGSTFSIAVLTLLNITAEVQTRSSDVRFSAFEQDPNSFAGVLSLGLLALVGLAYGRKITDKKIRFFVKLAFIFFAVSIIQTGSRGALLALLTGLLVFGLKRGNLVSKLKVALIVLLALVVLIGFSYQYELVRERWERTFTEGDLAGRDKIFLLAWGMFLEKPLFGWGPEVPSHELGYRYNDPSGRKSTHNAYLTILLEVGIVGAVFFFSGLWICALAAWQARNGPQGILPMAMLSCVFMINMSLSWHTKKLHWVVLAYALASASHVVSHKLRRRAVPQRHRWVIG